MTPRMFVGLVVLFAALGAGYTAMWYDRPLLGIWLTIGLGLASIACWTDWKSE